VISDKNLLFQGRTIEKFPLCVKEKGTTRYVVSVLITGFLGIYVGVRQSIETMEFIEN
jgi:hypothetical protein